MVGFKLSKATLALLAIANVIVRKLWGGEVSEDIAEEVDLHAANQRFHGLLDRIPEELAKEVAKYDEYENVPKSISKKVDAYFRKVRFAGFVSRLPEELAEEVGQYPSYSKVPRELKQKIAAYYEQKYIKDLAKRLPEDLAQELGKYSSYDEIPAEVNERIDAHFGRSTEKATSASTDEGEQEKPVDDGSAPRVKTLFGILEEPVKKPGKFKQWFLGKRNLRWQTGYITEMSREDEDDEYDKDYYDEEPISTFAARVLGSTEKHTDPQEESAPAPGQVTDESEITVPQTPEVATIVSPATHCLWVLLSKLLDSDMHSLYNTVPNKNGTFYEMAGFKLSRFLIAFLAFVQIVAGNGVEAEVDIAPEDPKPVFLRVAPGSCPFNGGSEPSGEVEGGKVEVPATEAVAPIVSFETADGLVFNERASDRIKQFIAMLPSNMSNRFDPEAKHMLPADLAKQLAERNDYKLTREQAEGVARYLLKEYTKIIIKNPAGMPITRRLRQYLGMYFYTTLMRAADPEDVSGNGVSPGWRRDPHLGAAHAKEEPTNVASSADVEGERFAETPEEEAARKSSKGLTRDLYEDILDLFPEMFAHHLAVLISRRPTSYLPEYIVEKVVNFLLMETRKRYGWDRVFGMLGKLPLHMANQISRQLPIPRNYHKSVVTDENGIKTVSWERQIPDVKLHAHGEIGKESPAANDDLTKKRLQQFIDRLSTHVTQKSYLKPYEHIFKGSDGLLDLEGHEKVLRLLRNAKPGKIPIYLSDWLSVYIGRFLLVKHYGDRPDGWKNGIRWDRRYDMIRAYIKEALSRPSKIVLL
ncbi:uncharacterized protein BXIN_0234 [Babesia sp. Xinjiang]|uniref:uncharacterized protein n=1 Tax=Babesia sp. Xinjiang TaxID=462227 RepID=UPI000A21F2B5|nr:uncharacterized protein BXIN_0234 [Babesia sp. Xinjiang]ORM39878.1 hypothetical protein BXIN_0234 [Babesia sp. Xinjiang]